MLVRPAEGVVRGQGLDIHTKDAIGAARGENDAEIAARGSMILGDPGEDDIQQLGGRQEKRLTEGRGPVHILFHLGERDVLEPKHLARGMVREEDARHAADAHLEGKFKETRAHEIVKLALVGEIEPAVLGETVPRLAGVVGAVKPDRSAGARLELKVLAVPLELGIVAIELGPHHCVANAHIRVGLGRDLSRGVARFEIVRPVRLEELCLELILGRGEHPLQGLAQIHQDLVGRGSRVDTPGLIGIDGVHPIERGHDHTHGRCRTSRKLTVEIVVRPRQSFHIDRSEPAKLEIELGQERGHRRGRTFDNSVVLDSQRMKGFVLGGRHKGRDTTKVNLTRMVNV